MNYVIILKTITASLLMALKRATELQLLWFIETIQRVSDYQTLQAFSGLNCMPFC